MKGRWRVEVAVKAVIDGGEDMVGWWWCGVGAESRPNENLAAVCQSDPCFAVSARLASLSAGVGDAGMLK